MHLNPGLLFFSRRQHSAITSTTKIKQDIGFRKRQMQNALWPFLGSDSFKIYSSAVAFSFMISSAKRAVMMVSDAVATLFAVPKE
jgi:hypothetical protein